MAQCAGLLEGFVTLGTGRHLARLLKRIRRGDITVQSITFR